MATDSLPEEWRPVEGFPHYEVSNLGRVRRAFDSPIHPWTKPGMVRNPRPMRDGYIPINLPRPNGPGMVTIKAHRLVCIAFHGPQPSPDHEVAHNNGVRHDNRASNLRWATTSENQRDRIAHGTTVRGVRNGRAKLSPQEVRQIRALFSGGRRKAHLARLYGLGQTTITRIVNRTAWSWLD